MKTAILHPKAREVIRSFPDPVKEEIGQLLFMLQLGKTLSMPQSRPMPSVAPGVEAVRVRAKDGIYRTFYYTRSELGILVFHAFKKKTQATPHLEIELA